MKNKYEIRGDVTTIFYLSKKHGPIEFLIDTDDLEKVNSFLNTWLPRWDKKAKSFYISGHLINENGVDSGILLHRLIMHPPKDMVVDHINHDTLDNRKVNLRVLSRSENRQNLNVFSKTSSGVRGVHYHKATKKWQGTVTKDGKRMFYGLFDSIEEAEVAVIEARKKCMPFTIEAA